MQGCTHCWQLQRTHHTASCERQDILQQPSAQEISIALVLRPLQVLGNQQGMMHRQCLLGSGSLLGLHLGGPVSGLLQGKTRPLHSFHNVGH